jgi:hypothetical protein
MAENPQNAFNLAEQIADRNDGSTHFGINTTTTEVVSVNAATDAEAIRWLTGSPWFCNVVFRLKGLRPELIYP